MLPRRTFFTHWLPPLCWMTLIFLGSTGALSATHTSRFVGPFLRWLLGGSFTMEKAEFGHFLIRKAGHFTEYAALSGLLWRALGTAPTFANPARIGRRFAGAVLLAAFYAASDEFHQSFVPSRTASPVDVMIDTFGAALGLLLILRSIRLAATAFRRGDRPARLPRPPGRS